MISSELYFIVSVIFFRFDWLYRFFFKAYSIAPLLVYPTHYTGEAGYISDTESSEIVPDIVRNASSKDGKTGKGSKEIEIDDKISKIELPALGETGSIPATTSASSSTASQIEEIGNNIGKEFHSELWMVYFGNK